MGIERLVRGVDRFHLRQRNGTGGGAIFRGRPGAYFVRMADGDVDYALPDNCARAVRNLTEKGHVVKSVALAPRDTTFAWFIRYE